MLARIMGKQHWNSTPKYIGDVETGEQSLLVGDIIEVEGEEYYVVERRWTPKGFTVIAEAGTGYRIVQA